MVKTNLELQRLGVRYENYAESQEAAWLPQFQEIIDAPESTREDKESARVAIAKLKEYSSRVRAIGAELQSDATAATF